MAKKTPQNDGVDGCMVTACSRTPRSRGLCDIHYTYLSMKVKKGLFTWDKLVQAGACLERKHKRSDTGIGLMAYLKGKGINEG